MADMMRTTSVGISATPHWNEVDKALTTLDQRSDKNKHVRAETAHTNLYVHDNKESWHGLGSPKEKYAEGVRLIKAALDNDFGQGTGDLVFRNIGIKHDSDGLKLKHIGALRREVAKLPSKVGQFDGNQLKAQLGGATGNPKLGPKEFELGNKSVMVSGQSLRDIGTGNYEQGMGGYTVRIGDQPKVGNGQVVQGLDDLTEGNPSHLMALSKILNQQAGNGIFAALKGEIGSFVTDTFRTKVDFDVARGQDGYTVSIGYSAPLKMMGSGMEGTMAATDQQSAVRAQVKLHIPFDAISKGGDVDWGQVRLDQQKPPSFGYTFHPGDM